MASLSESIRTALQSLHSLSSPTPQLLSHLKSLSLQLHCRETSLNKQTLAECKNLTARLLPLICARFYKDFDTSHPKPIYETFKDATISLLTRLSQFSRELTSFVVATSLNHVAGCDGCAETFLLLDALCTRSGNACSVFQAPSLYNRLVDVVNTYCSSFGDELGSIYGKVRNEAVGIDRSLKGNLEKIFWVQREELVEGAEHNLLDRSMQAESRKSRRSKRELTDRSRQDQSIVQPAPEPEPTQAHPASHLNVQSQKSKTKSTASVHNKGGQMPGTAKDSSIEDDTFYINRELVENCGAKVKLRVLAMQLGECSMATDLAALMSQRGSSEEIAGKSVMDEQLNNSTQTIVFSLFSKVIKSMPFELLATTASPMNALFLYQLTQSFQESQRHSLCKVGL